MLVVPGVRVVYWDTTNRFVFVLCKFSNMFSRWFWRLLLDAIGHTGCLKVKLIKRKHSRAVPVTPW